jgi:hypothetical protein
MNKRRVGGSEGATAGVVIGIALSAVLGAVLGKVCGAAAGASSARLALTKLAAQLLIYGRKSTAFFYAFISQLQCGGGVASFYIRHKQRLIAGHQVLRGHARSRRK